MRDKRAVFVGSDSGMLEGQRRALVRLSRSRPKEIYARFVEGGLQPYEHGLEDYKDMVVPKLNMSDQIDMFQKVVYAGGELAVKCIGAADRLVTAVIMKARAGASRGCMKGA